MQVIFILIFTITTSILFGDVVDFGVVGPQHEIAEENGNEMIQKGIKKLDLKKIKRDIIKKIEDSKTSHLNMKTSTEDKEIVLEDIYRSSFDITNPSTGEIIYKKGDIIPTKLPYGSEFSLCFVDGDVKESVLDEIILAFGNKCKYMVNNISIDDFEKRYKQEAFPMGGQNTIFLKRYNIDFLPTKITRFSTKIKRETLSIKRLSMEEK